MFLRRVSSSFLFVLSLSSVAFAQNSKMVSDLDQDLEIKNILWLPLIDNVNGILSTPLQSSYKSAFESDQRWNLIIADAEKSFPNVEDLEDHPEKVNKLQRSYKTQAVVAGRILRGPKGTQIKLEIFAGGLGWPLVLQNSPEIESIAIADVQKLLLDQISALKAQLPYDGLILSRRESQVTLNLGSALGVRSGEEVEVVQIFKVNRHPRLHFLVGVEKVLLAKVHIDRAEEHLSFGTITSERDGQGISSGAKVVRANFKKTQFDSKSVSQQGASSLGNSTEAPVAYGEAPREWRPVPQASFGKIGILFGLGNYGINDSLDVGSSSSTSSLTPSIHLDGEMWLNPNWFLGLDLRQFVFRTPNGYPNGGSTPSKLNVSTNITSFQAGYNVLIHDKFFGPKVQLSLGMSQMSSAIDNSTPTAFTSVKYSAWTLGVGGSFPVALESGGEFTLGGRLLYYFKPSMSESPVYSGDVSNNQVSSFSGYGIYGISPRISVRGELCLDSFSSRLSNSGDRANSSTSISHTMTTVGGGIEYSF